MALALAPSSLNLQNLVFLDFAYPPAPVKNHPLEVDLPVRALMAVTALTGSQPPLFTPAP